jgi:twinkle protein
LLINCFRPLFAPQNPPKDANDALRQGDPALIPAMIRAAQLPTNEMFVTFADERASVLQGIEGMQEHAGSVSTSLPGLTDLCKGFRRGELVIFTGPTGM